MGNKIARIILGIVIAVAVIAGVYFVLPGQYKNPITQTIQMKTNSNYNEIVDVLKKTTIPKNKEKEFGAVFEAAVGNPAWTIKEISVDDAGNGAYDVYADGYKTTISVENEDNSDGMVTHTNAHIRLIFHITKNGKEIKIGDDVLEPGKSAYPATIEVDETTYNESDESTYYQKTLDCLVELGG